MSNSWLGKRAASSVPAPISIAPSQEFDGNDGPWSTFPIQIGTPPQTVKVLVSTASSQIWAVVPDGCVQSDPANCSISRGGLFQPNSSSTWNRNQDAAGGLFPINLEINLNDTGVGLYGYDTVTLGGQGSSGPTLDQQVVAGIATKAFYLGLFGLNPESMPLPETSAPLPNYLSSMNQSDLIPSLSWSYTAGNQYRPGPAYGSLTLGGYDSSRFEPNDVLFPFNGTASRSLTVNIGEIYLTTNDTYTILGTSNESISAAIDSTTPYIILPLNVCQQFEEAFGITWDTNVQAYLVNETLHNALQTQNTSIVLNLGNSSTIPGEGFNISLPYAAFDLTAEAPLLKNSSRYFPLMRGSNQSQITLGRTFLQEAYVIADYERKNFSVSQCTWESGAKSHIVAIRRPGDKTSSTSHRLSPGSIAGIVIGAAVIVIIVVVLGIMLRKKRGRDPKKSKPMQFSTAATELDSSGNDPYSIFAGSKVNGLPHSPELDSAVHKGHELDGSPQLDQGVEVEEPLYELEATSRRSRTLTSPISLLSERSDATRLHQRQQSDPVSLSSVVSDAPKVQEQRLSEPTSPVRERSDAARRLRREISNPASSTSEARGK